MGREIAGSEGGAAILSAAEPFDLCVIDEAHEIFANIYRRYDRVGIERADSPEARIASRVRSFLRQSPVLLLTATPIQNNLTEPLRANIDETLTAAIITEQGGKEKHRGRSQDYSSFCSQFG